MGAHGIEACIRRVFLPLGFVGNGYNGRRLESEMIMSIAPPAVKD
jgi:hypothetical protein